MQKWLGYASIVLGVISMALGAYVEFGLPETAGADGYVPALLGLASIVIGAIVLRQLKHNDL
ncbi:MAG: LPXTG cell wall anchor domain-containing protein [Henriciella sp.]|uniref:LPXTG cell wall anchor domain-containing protein n=1 Tax=Henriciella sp. TaxID=1968823 RepID=UPI003C777AB8